MIKKKALLAYILSVLIFTTVLTGCNTSANNKPMTKQAVLLDTMISISIYDSTDQSVLNQCIQICKDYEQLFSRTIETSEISKINQAQGQPVTVSSDTIELIEKGLSYCELSDGAFDITIAPLSTLWDFKNNTGTIPDQDKIEEAKSHVNYKNVQVNGQTVTLTDAQASIDLGGIAKGFIADKIKEYLESEDIKHAIINLGGNVLTIGNKMDGSDFHIGIQKPFDPQNEAITSVDINNQSVVSSGVYERYFKLNNKIYHHILNPATGFPYENNLLEVSIISNQSVDGDGLSTTCFALGLEKGMDFIDSLDHTEAIFITDDYQLHYSKGLQP